MHAAHLRNGIKHREQQSLSRNHGFADSALLITRCSFKGSLKGNLKGSLRHKVLVGLDHVVRDISRLKSQKSRLKLIQVYLGWALGFFILGVYKGYYKGAIRLL